MRSDGVVTPPLAAEAALTDAELDAVQRRLAARVRALVRVSPGWFEAATGLAIALLGAFLADLIGATTERDGLTIFVLLLAAYAAGMLAMALLTARYQSVAVVVQRRSTSFLHARRRYQFGEDGIRVNGGMADALWSWQALTEAEEAGGLLLFWVGNAHGFGVPARGFAGPEAAAAALAYARARIAAAHLDRTDHRSGPA